MKEQILEFIVPLRTFSLPAMELGRSEVRLEFEIRMPELPEQLRAGQTLES